MQGSIRALIGFMIAFGSVGTMETNPNASLLVQVAVATIGLAIMYSGVRALTK